jgi:hypothetical protein
MIALTIPNGPLIPLSTLKSAHVTDHGELILESEGGSYVTVPNPDVAELITALGRLRDILPEAVPKAHHHAAEAKTTGHLPAAEPKRR